ncbi:uncharacterized protein C8A04DRAFT_36635 [Dichotomopilus funicola]|uniref:Small ribosomal subunit protein mS38 n=1 Tax=Dichotomopilus funicola TaxID=1934379 RepID=A0AAN6V4S2_9PEZI|nr:hypothetical protein C8A04DRAFT_36635 [Dichotomopilus funicola]
MLPPSVRRAVATAPQSPTASTLASTVSRAAAAACGITYRPSGLQQRRYSSSKPSSPDNGPKDITARPVPTSRGSKSEKSKAKSKAPQPPSVPSTGHIGDEGLALSAFFALHRPISVTQLMPRTVSDDVFAKIFATRSRNNRAADVLSTLSQTVSDLEEPLSRMNMGGSGDKTSRSAQDAVASEDGTTRLSLKHPDGSETNLHIQLNPLAGQYLPYAPPPAPRPLSETASNATNANTENTNAAKSAADGQTRVYKAMVTIEETVDAEGQVKVVAHSPELVEEGMDSLTSAIEEPGQPQSFLERMALRQLRYDEYCRQKGLTMQAISVRRQRKLRMKKKKYKKLMKKTRNERRKLDRL